MIKRFRVACKMVKFKGITYQTGDLLPEHFTERDRYRNLYPSRIEEVFLEEEADVEAAVKTEASAEKEKEVSIEAAGTVENIVPAAIAINTPTPASVKGIKAPASPATLTKTTGTKALTK